MQLYRAIFDIRSKTHLTLDVEILLNISCLAARSEERGTGRLGFLSSDDDAAPDDDPGAEEAELVDLVLGMDPLLLGSKHTKSYQVCISLYYVIDNYCC